MSASDTATGPVLGRRGALRLLIAGAALAAPAWGVSRLTSTPAPLAPGQKVRLLQLGASDCTVCGSMEPVLEAVRQKHGSQVDVVFQDVKKDRSLARQYRVFMIPTQVVLDGEGTEVFRHEGYFGLEEIEAVLAELGVR